GLSVVEVSANPPYRGAGHCIVFWGLWEATEAAGRISVRREELTGPCLNRDGITRLPPNGFTPLPPLKKSRKRLHAPETVITEFTHHLTRYEVLPAGFASGKRALRASTLDASGFDGRTRHVEAERLPLYVEAMDSVGVF